MDYTEGMNLISQVSQANNAWSAEQAQKQMAFEERMSNTAHQREVADLKAAGLNPILSAHGSGASTPTGAMGSTDTNITSALYGLVKDAIQSQMVSAEAVASVAHSASGSGSGKNSSQKFTDAPFEIIPPNSSKDPVEKVFRGLAQDYDTKGTTKIFGIPIQNKTISRALNYVADHTEAIVATGIGNLVGAAANKIKGSENKKSSNVHKSDSGRAHGGSSGSFSSTSAKKVNASSVKSIKRMVK